MNNCIKRQIFLYIYIKLLIIRSIKIIKINLFFFFLVQDAIIPNFKLYLFIHLLII